MRKRGRCHRPGRCCGRLCTVPSLVHGSWLCHISSATIQLDAVGGLALEAGELYGVHAWSSVAQGSCLLGEASYSLSLSLLQSYILPIIGRSVHTTTLHGRDGSCAALAQSSQVSDANATRHLVQIAAACVASSGVVGALVAHSATQTRLVGVIFFVRSPTRARTPPLDRPLLSTSVETHHGWLVG